MPDADRGSKPDVGKPEESVSQGTSIEIRNLTVLAGKRTLLNAATCSFPAGEVILLLGCSGVGKSVLLKILAGLIGPEHEGIQYSGDVSFVAGD
ncbi:MAG: ATP-binding cassette domain-containing protein, partial [Fuerstia sp.]|nr:ATP-binding cassette domain-containing protein [Fuerstiella sp.]